MAKGKTTAFFCKECGYESSKWMGQCPGCKEWNTFVEEPVSKGKNKQSVGLARLGEQAKPMAVSDISLDEEGNIENYDEVWGLTDNQYEILDDDEIVRFIYSATKSSPTVFS